ncbi:MAG: response regulator [Bacillota bacterium]
MIRLLLADDHTLVRQGIRHILEMESGLQVVGEAGNGEETLNMARSLRPDVILMDVNMPVMNGVEATRLIRQEMPEIAVVALTIHDDEEYLFELVKVGAAGYLLKDVEPASLIEAIHRVAQGQSYLHPAVAAKLMGGYNRLLQEKETVATTSKLLSEREVEVLVYIAKGQHNDQIAETLFISEKTVKNHITNILRKLDVEDRTQAVIKAVKLGLVKLE